jgi:hypothetical protein
MFYKVLAASRLRDNARVWLAASGRWTRNIDEAFVARHAEAVGGLREASRAAASDGSVTDAEIIDVEEIGTRLRPVHSRTRIHSGGFSDSRRKAAA